MPRWLRKQLMQAFLKRDLRQIRFLNQCWFAFYKRMREESVSS